MTARGGRDAAIRSAGLLMLCISLGTAGADAQAPIQDNSFLIEEAYNQERGVVQHISTVELPQPADGVWEYAFTQEWSLGGIRHQLGYTLPLLDAGAGAGVGDIGINYRIQVAGNPEAPLLASPRLTLLLPTGSVERGRGAGGPGVQLNMPVTIVAASRLVTHWNAGMTFMPSASAPPGGSAATTSVNLGAGAVWLIRPSFNLLVEGIWASDASAVADGVTARAESAWLSPGIRGAFNAGAVQVVPGIAYMIGVGPSRGDEALFFYLSLEHAFIR